MNEPPTAKARKPWFSRNRSGVGWHPSFWPAWLMLAVVVATIVVVVILLRTGVL